MASAQSALRQAELNLSYTQVTAPFDGRIGRSIASIGELVGPTSGSLVNVVSISPIYVSFSLLEKNLLDIMEAMEREVINNENLDLAPPVFARLPNGIVLEEEGEIVFMDNRVDPATGTISVRAVFQNE